MNKQSSEQSSPAAPAATMTSLQIAEVTGKRHRDLLRSIRAMEPAWEKVNGRKFALVEYTDPKGEARPCYSLTKTECLYIATKFNDEARARLVLRWEELEREAAQKAIPGAFELPFTDIIKHYRDIQSQLDNAVEWCLAHGRDIADLWKQYNNIVDFLNRLDLSQIPQNPAKKSVTTFSTTSIAGELGTTAIKLNQALYEAGVLVREDNRWQLAKQYTKRGLAENRYVEGTNIPFLVWTPAGRSFIIAKLVETGFLHLAEQQQPF